MKYRVSLFLILAFVCSLLSAAEWSWDTKGFSFQRIRMGEEGGWREIPPYVDSCVSNSAPSGTKLFVQWAQEEGYWLEDLTVIIDDEGLVPVISAVDYIEDRESILDTEREEKPNKIEMNLEFSIGYGSRIIGLTNRESLYSSDSRGFPRISLPDAITLEIREEAVFKLNKWGINACFGISDMIEPSPLYPSVFDSWNRGYVFSINPYVGLGVSFRWEKLEVKGIGEFGYSILSQAFADNAHTNDVLDIGIRKFSTSYTFGGVIEVFIPAGDKTSLCIKERLLLYYPSMYLYMETLMGIRVKI